MKVDENHKKLVAEKYAKYSAESSVDKKLSSPFFVMLTSGEDKKHCDLYPHGSIHEVKKCKDGHLWLTDRVDSLTDGFSTMILEKMPEVKTCPCCKNEFPVNWVFILDQENKVECCIRCFERGKMHFSDRDAYRQAIRDELKMELGIKD